MWSENSTVTLNQPESKYANKNEDIHIVFDIPTESGMTHVGGESSEPKEWLILIHIV